MQAATSPAAVIVPSGPAELVQLSCVHCGKPAAALAIPRLTAADQAKFRKIYRMLKSWEWMLDMELPDLADNGNPVTLGASMISRTIVHPECFARMLSQADGSHA